MTWFLHKSNRTILILALILVVGLTLRIIGIDNIPRAIYGDGLNIVYDAYSVLKTGQDQRGNFLPFTFGLGDNRPPGYVYATVPFTALFGPTALAANSVSILSGGGIIILLFLLGRYFFSARVGLLAAFFAAVSPWELSLSRGPFESHFALFLSLLGVYSYFKSKQNSRLLVLSALSFALSSLTYTTYPLTNPLLIILILLLDKGYLNFFPRYKVAGAISIIIIAVSLLLSILILHSENGPSRAESINIFNQPDINARIIQNINRDRNLETVPLNLGPLLHNRFWAYSALVWENYMENFQAGFLLIHGDGQPRHNPATNGEIYWATFILILGGIIFLYTRKNWLLWLIFGWILIAPVATAFVGGPHALRDSLMLPPLLLLVAFGAEKIFESKRKIKNAIAVLLMILFAAELIFFADEFYFVAPNKYARFWSFPAKQASLLAIENRTKFDYVILSSSIESLESAYPVYAKLEPRQVMAQNKTATLIDGFRIISYDNVYVGYVPQTRLKEFLSGLSGSYIYIGPETDKDFIDNPALLNGPDLLPDLAVTIKN